MLISWALFCYFPLSLVQLKDFTQWTKRTASFFTFHHCNKQICKALWAFGLQDSWLCCRTSLYSGWAERGDCGSEFLSKGPVWNSAGRGTSRTVVYLITVRGERKKERGRREKQREIEGFVRERVWGKGEPKKERNGENNLSFLHQKIQAAECDML